MRIIDCQLSLAAITRTLPIDLYESLIRGSCASQAPSIILQPSPQEQPLCAPILSAVMRNASLRGLSSQEHLVCSNHRRESAILPPTIIAGFSPTEMWCAKERLFTRVIAGVLSWICVLWNALSMCIFADHPRPYRCGFALSPARPIDAGAPPAHQRWSHPFLFFSGIIDKPSRKRHRSVRVDHRAQQCPSSLHATRVLAQDSPVRASIRPANQPSRLGVLSACVFFILFLEDHASASTVHIVQDPPHFIPRSPIAAELDQNFPAYFDKRRSSIESHPPLTALFRADRYAN